MAMKLHGARFSTCTTRALAALYEKEADFEFVDVDVASGAHKKPAFLAMQPFGMVPVLVDGDLTLFESRAIARFVECKYEGQGTALYGSTPHEQALVEQWLEVESQNFNPPAAALVKEVVAKFFHGGKPDPAKIEDCVQKLGKVLDVYDAHLAKSKYLAGDFFSVADLSHLPTINHIFMFVKRGDVIEDRPHVKAWWEDISCRPSWKKISAGIRQTVPPALL